MNRDARDRHIVGGGHQVAQENAPAAPLTLLKPISYRRCVDVLVLREDVSADIKKAIREVCKLDKPGVNGHRETNQ